jgi:hypothetical protein
MMDAEPPAPHVFHPVLVVLAAAQLHVRARCAAVLSALWLCVRRTLWIEVAVLWFERLLSWCGTLCVDARAGATDNEKQKAR